MKLPFEGELILPEKQKYQETIIFVHFYGGKKENLKRHVKFVNELGYKAVIFNLSPFQPLKYLINPPISSVGRFGLRHIWADEIEQLINLVPGTKIFYSFSSPTSAVIETIARRYAADIKGLIGDYRPFVHLWECFANFLSEEKKNKIVRIATNAFFLRMWSSNHDGYLAKDLDSLPAGFRILSIRGEQDHLVPTYAIEDAFKGHNKIKLEVLNIKKGDHLNGLRDFAEIYTPKVTEFLTTLSNE
jgi:hypothetical protein